MSIARRLRRFFTNASTAGTSVGWDDEYELRRRCDDRHEKGQAFKRKKARLSQEVSQTNGQKRG